jgi:hypothetical protein
MSMAAGTGVGLTIKTLSSHVLANKGIANLISAVVQTEL